MGKETILGVLRHSLTFVGGFLVTKGLLDEGMLTEIVGSTIALTGVIWSIIDKNKKA